MDPMTLGLLKPAGHCNFKPPRQGPNGHLGGAPWALIQSSPTPNAAIFMGITCPGIEYPWALVGFAPLYLQTQSRISQPPYHGRF